MCDTPLTVRRAALLAAYAQALAAWHLEARPREPERAVYLVNSNNRFDRGQVPKTVRLRAVTVARFNLYNGRVWAMLRN